MLITSCTNSSTTVARACTELCTVDTIAAAPHYHTAVLHADEYANKLQTTEDIVKVKATDLELLDWCTLGVLSCYNASSDDLNRARTAAMTASHLTVHLINRAC
jgi:hypothetical protein